MKSKGFLIMGEFFATKTALEDRIRQIRDRYADNWTLTPDDFDFMSEVLEGHPEYDQKRGPGIVSMCVRTNPVYRNNRCFYLTRADGSETDFSFRECLTPTPHSKKFERALRTAIEPFTMEFKRAFFESHPGPNFCPVTGEPIEFLGSHVDHCAPRTFQRLVTDFVQEFHIDIDKVALIGDGLDNCYQDTLADPDLLEKWTRYHNTFAVLEVVSRRANLSDRKRINDMDLTATRRLA